MKQKESRIIGLDILRSIAVLSVVFCHSLFLFMDEKTQPNNFVKHIISIGPYGSLGVDLFFALSGFLIGGILLKLIANNEFGEIHYLKQFWMRRWLRTLPNYYLLLIMNIVVVIIFKEQLNFNWRYLFFCQNTFSDTPNFFPESWSLCIEEWFYFTLPLLLFISLTILKKRNRKQVIFSTLIFYLICCTSIRFFCDLNKVSNFNENFKKVTFYRLDAISYGVLAAYFFHYYEFLFQKFKNIIVVIGFLLLMILVYCNHKNITANESNFLFYFNRYFYLSVSAIAFTCLIPFFYYLKNIPNGITKICSFFSAISYSLYLTNLSLFEIINKIELHIAVKYFIYWVTCIALSFTIYKYFELPILKLRDRNYK